MQGLETALRNALTRAGNPDAETRQRVYASARQAVQNSFAKQADVAPEVINQQRIEAESVIARVEKEFAERERASATTPVPTIGSIADPAPSAPGGAPDIGSAPQVMPDDAFRRRSDAEPPIVSVDRDGRAGRDVNFDDRAPSVDRSDSFSLDGPRSSMGRREPDMGLATEPTASTASAAVEGAASPSVAGDVRPGRGKRGFLRRGGGKPKVETVVEAPRRKKKRRGGALIGLALQLGFVLLLIAGALWFISANGGIEQVGRNLAESGAGLLAEPSEDGASVPGQRVGAGQFTGEWITVVETDTVDSVSAGSAATVDVVDDTSEPFLRIQSVSAGEDGEVRIALQGDVAEALAAGPATVALTVRSAGEGVTQIYVRCSFPAEAGCGRRRFEVNQTPADLLLDIDLGAAGGAANGGTVMLNADVAGEGAGIDLLSVRLRPGA
ncbi:hypothetical protein GCM10007908_02520 [Rhizobium albus]|nr:hypothetical protein GCM10007908_02520 [Rhizobium albus]